MNSIKIKITLESPVLLASNTGDPNMVGTYPYIPARALRGLFAREYIKRVLNGDTNNAHENEEFHRWFLRGALRFTDAFILYEDKMTMPLPFSIQKEKRGKDIYDLLFEETEIQTKPYGGYGRIENNMLYRKEVKLSVNLHHERDREKGISKEGIIYNYESIDPGQSFGACIFGIQKDLDKFKETFTNGIYYLGRSRNNQYGKVYIDFNANIQELPQPQDLSIGELSLTLLSDTIIYNEYGFPTTNIEYLEKLLGCTIKKSFIKTSDVESFVSRWRLKTPSEVSFTAGSTFLIEVPDEETLEKLRELQFNGIGERTEEGFGRFILGIQREARPKEKLEEDRKPSKPEGSPPEMVKDIILETLKNHLINLAVSEAIEDATKVKNPPTPSLIGRLLLMLRESKKIDNFKAKLEKLRRIAREKLEESRIGSKSLLEYLSEFDPKKISDFKKIREFSTRNDYQGLTKISEKNPIEDETFRETLCYEKLHTFLSTLMKEAKKK